MLSSLAAKLRQSLSILHKQDIQTAAIALNGAGAKTVRVGDDCAAIPDRDGYLLFAAEGMLPQLVESDPWFAGWCAVMVNISDIAAMGGRAIAIVDAVWSQSARDTQAVWAGMNAASQAYDVPIVGGHTNCHSPYNALAVAILGRATQLITSFDARSGDALLVVSDFRGKLHSHYPFWNAATDADRVQLRENLALLPHLAERGLCAAGKDISMGGILGTLLMLLETSGCGAILDLDQIPCPPELSLDRWLVTFPSYGFLLSVAPDNVAAVQACFQNQGLVCERVGTVQTEPELILRFTSERSHAESTVFWDFRQQPLTGFCS